MPVKLFQKLMNSKKIKDETVCVGLIAYTFTTLSYNHIKNHTSWLGLSYNIHKLTNK